MRIATIDVGTNTALLLIAEVGPGGMHPLHQAQRFVRLGEGVDAEGRIGAAALARLRAALLDYRALMETWQVEAVVVGATSASRDAENRDAVVDFVYRETGLPYEILSGEEEAAWTFAGAVSAFDDVTGPCAVLDIGGGSTELIVGAGAPGHFSAEALHFRQSLNVGAVRLTERFFSAQPPAPEEVAAAEAFTRDLLARWRAPLDAAVPFIAAAGTATSLALVHGGAATWEALPPGADRLTAAQVAAWRARLLRLTVEEVLALNPPVMTGRADVFPAGILILDCYLRHLGVPRCRVSPRGLRHGLALRFMAR